MEIMVHTLAVPEAGLAYMLLPPPAACESLAVKTDREALDQKWYQRLAEMTVEK